MSDPRLPERDRPWMMRTYAGHSTAKASNALYRSNLAKGQTGLSVAFDLPTQTGYDPDHVLARGDVGKVGVPVAHLGHMRTLLDGIPPGEMNTSMTINATAAWLLGLYVANAQDQGVPDYQAAFAAVFGQGLWTIWGSVIAFLIGQLIDVGIFHRIRRATGERHVWLRATGSTAVSQLVDSFVVVFIALYIGLKLPFVQVMAICTLNYIYKGSVAILMTPVIYLVHGAIERYLGHDLAAKMKEAAQSVN